MNVWIQKGSDSADAIRADLIIVWLGSVLCSPTSDTAF